MKNYYSLVGLILSSTGLFSELPDIDIKPFHALISGNATLQKGPDLPAYDLVTNIKIEPVRSNMKTLSVIVPSHYAHAKHLYPLLTSLEEQTVLPDEVVISLSEYTRVPRDIMNVLEDSRWPFPVTIVMSKPKLYSAQNRNVASTIAKGDIFMYNDADDLSHPQRIEIIKFFFNSYNLDILMHRFIELRRDTNVPIVHYQDVDFLCPSDYSKILGRDIHNGNTAISRQVFNVFKWPDFRSHEDEFYNRILYNYFGNRLIVFAPLIIYRNYLSCGYQQNLESIDAHIVCESGRNLNKEYPITFIYNSVLYQS